MEIYNSLKSDDYLAIGNFLKLVEDNQLPGLKYSKYGNNHNSLALVLILKMQYLLLELDNLKQDEVDAVFINSPISFGEKNKSHFKNTLEIRNVRTKNHGSWICFGNNKIHYSIPFFDPFEYNYTIDGLVLFLKYYLAGPNSLKSYLNYQYGLKFKSFEESNIVTILKFLYTWNIKFFAKDLKDFLEKTPLAYYYSEALEDIIEDMDLRQHLKNIQ